MMGKGGTTPNRKCELALDLTSTAVTLFVRSELDAWTHVGQAILGADDFSEQIDALRVEALVRGSERDPVLLWLPPEQVISRTLELAPGSEDAARAEATQKIAKETDFDAAELTVAMADTDDPKATLVMGALLQTVQEAREYGARWGFPNTVVSTRTSELRFGPDGPVFAPPQTIVRQAGNAMRRLAVAATVLLAIGGAAYGGFHALQPLLQEPADIRSTGPALTSFAVVLDPISPEASPFEQVRIGGVGSLAIQRLLVPDAERLNAYGKPRHLGPFTSDSPVELMAPSEGAPMQVGGAPVHPDYQRPGRLSAVVALPAAPETAAVRLAIQRIRLAGPPKDGEADQTGPSFKRAEPTETPVESERLAALAPPADEDLGKSLEAGLPAEPDDTPPAEDVEKAPAPAEPETPAGAPAEDEPETPSEATVEEEASPQAPIAMDDTPKPRPGNFDAIVAAATPKAPPAKNEEAAVAAAPVEDAADDETPASTAASLVPSASDEAQAEAETTPEPEVDPNEPTVFAALKAPAPSKRPKVFERVAKRPVSTQRTIAAVNIPRTVRSAAQKVGLALDETSLIGVIDARTGRKALVRMPTGDFRKVGKGDVLDGWRVSSISREAMRLTKRGQNRTLLLVSR